MANAAGRNSAQRGWRGAEGLVQIPNLGDGWASPLSSPVLLFYLGREPELSRKTKPRPAESGIVL